MIYVFNAFGLRFFQRRCQQGRPEPVTQATIPFIFTGKNLVIDIELLNMCMDWPRAELSSADHRTSEEAL